MDNIKHKIIFLTRESISPRRFSDNLLDANQMVVVFIRNDQFLDSIDDIFNVLLPHEKERALKIPILDVRHRYIIQKGWLRILLAEFLDCSEDIIEFEIAQFGKPSLKNNPHHRFIHFNISHTNRYALYIFAKDNHVGIDIEEIPTDGTRLTDAIFWAATTSEIRALKELEPRLRMSRFLKLWTKKEAISKALGFGLNIDFKDLEIGIDENSHARFFLNREINLVDISMPALFFASLAFF